jgi:hypothetical protein
MINLCQVNQEADRPFFCPTSEYCKIIFLQCLIFICIIYTLIKNKRLGIIKKIERRELSKVYLATEGEEWA